jgi:hypothetical protein
MYFMTYVSSATTQFSNDELVDLLDISRRNNELSNITGMLLYKEGNFLQVLEGEKSAVKALFEKVSRDPRHKGVLVLLEGEIDQRDFPDWSMGFKNLTALELDDVKGYNEFLNLSFQDEELISNPSKSQKLLLSFKKNMR